MGGHDDCDVPFRLLNLAQGTLLWWPILRRIGENWHTDLQSVQWQSTVHNGWKNRNMDARVNIADDSSTSDKHLVRFGPVTRSLLPRLRAGRVKRWALPRI